MVETMKRLHKTTAILGTGLIALALLAAPTWAGGNHGTAGALTAQPVHMSQGQQGGWGGQYGHQGMMGQGMMGHPMMNPGMMGYGMRSPGTMGYGMMNPGFMGQGMMGYGMMAPGTPQSGDPCQYGAAQAAGEDLSADDVRANLEQRLAMHGNKRLKVGDVTETDDDTIVADIVTVDGSLVQRLEIDRHTQATRPVQ
jgi:hypothetical protein